MGSGRRNPSWSTSGLYSPEDEDGGDILGVSVEDELGAIEVKFRAQQAEKEAAESARRRMEAAGSAVGIGVDPRALELARTGLEGSLTDAQELYADLDARMERIKRDRALRTAHRQARRLLEDAWGVNALRREPRPSQEKRFVVKVPLYADDPKGARIPLAQVQAVASFDRRYVPLGRGIVGTRMELDGVYYGVEGQGRGDVKYAKLLLAEAARYADKITELRQRGMTASDGELARVIEKQRRNWQEQRELLAARGETVKKLGELLKPPAR